MSQLWLTTDCHLSLQHWIEAFLADLKGNNFPILQNIYATQHVIAHDVASYVAN